MKKKAHIITYGCQMNKYDSEVIAGLLERENYLITQTPKDATLILLNTCSVRKHAEEKVYSKLGALLKLKKRNSDLVVGVCGCMAKRLGSALLRKFPSLDLVVGPNDIESLPSLLCKVNKEPQVAINGEERRIVPFCIRRERKFKAWIPVIFGCNKFCSYCIVPYVRGKQRSRRSAEIIDEVRSLVDEGVVEVTLLGQNVVAYGKDIRGEMNFADLLRRINELPGLRRIRFITSHPKDTTEELIFAVKESSKVCEHFHLPLQAASNKILSLMNRGYSKEFYRDLISLIREEVPDSTITTDLLVGFPGEEECDFAETMSFVEEVRFDAAFTFAFSPRDGTKAFHLPNKVPESIKQKRLERLISLQTKITKKKNEKLIGTTLEVLIEGENPKNPYELIGRSRGDKVVIVPKEAVLEAGRCVDVKINEASTYSMRGEFVKEAIGK